PFGHPPPRGVLLRPRVSGGRPRARFRLPPIRAQFASACAPLRRLRVAANRPIGLPPPAPRPRLGEAPNRPRDSHEPTPTAAPRPHRSPGGRPGRARPGPLSRHPEAADGRTRVAPGPPRPGVDRPADSRDVPPPGGRQAPRTHQPRPDR